MQGIFKPRIIKLNNGRDILVRCFDQMDCCGVNHMVIDNFTYASNFKHFSESERRGYIQANSMDGVLEAGANPDNITCLVAEDIDGGNIVGYRLLRKGLHRVDGSVVAEGKRLHVARSFAGQGLGKALVEISGQIACHRGYSRMTVQASGNSRYFFVKIGFHCLLESVYNDVLKQRHIVSKIAYLEKFL